MKKSLYLLLFLIPILCTSSCVLLRPLKIGEIKSFKIKSANLSSAMIVIGMPVKNPNFFKVQVDEGDFEILVNNNKLGNAHLVNSIKVAAYSDKIQNIVVELKYDNILGGVFALAGSKELKVRCKGTANAKSLLFSKKIQVDVENNINLQQAFD